MRSPASPDLPEFRVDHSGCAFQVTGLDFAGPLYVKNNLNNDKVHRVVLFIWNLLQTCQLRDFYVDSKRFIARREMPEIVINDNFKTF